MMAQGRTLRQDVWDAAHTALAGAGIANARELADSITEKFSTGRGKGGVRHAVKAAIGEDLKRGIYSFAMIRDRHKVGMSTVQRVAAELRSKGETVRTTGQTNPGAAIN